MTKKPISTGRQIAQEREEGLRALTLRLPESLHKRLRLYAAEADLSRQRVIETALAEYLDRSGG